MDTKPMGSPRRLVRLVGITVLVGAMLLPMLPASPASAADTRTWVIDANTLVSTNIQEDDFWSDGDEPYIAHIGYRSRFGVPGSTNAVFRGGLRELSGGADDGDTMRIPDDMGRMSFPSVTRCSMLDISMSGCQPEVIGTVTIAMESDATPFGSMSSFFNDAANIVKQELGAVIETTSLPFLFMASSDPALQGLLADRMRAAISNIQARIQPPFWEALGLFLSSWGDPDDPIAARFTAFVTVDDSLTDLVNGFLAPLSDSTAVAGALAPRSFNLGFSGDGANYRVSYGVS